MEDNFSGIQITRQAETVVGGGGRQYVCVPLIGSSQLDLFSKSDGFPECSVQFGIVDADGGLSLWQTNTSGNAPKPYLVRKSLLSCLCGASPCPRAVSPSCLIQWALLVLLFVVFVSLCQTLQCHNKTAHDFVFVGSSSLIASAGLSTDNRYDGWRDNFVSIPLQSVFSQLNSVS